MVGRGASDEAARDGWHAGKVGEGGMGLNKVELTERGAARDSLHRGKRVAPVSALCVIL